MAVSLDPESQDALFGCIQVIHEDAEMVHGAGAIVTLFIRPVLLRQGVEGDIFVIGADMDRVAIIL